MSDERQNGHDVAPGSSSDECDFLGHRENLEIFVIPVKTGIYHVFWSSKIILPLLLRRFPPRLREIKGVLFVLLYRNSHFLQKYFLDRLFFRVHFFVFLVVFVVVSKQVECRVDEEFRELGFARIPVFLRLREDFRFGQDNLSGDFVIC